MQNLRRYQWLKFNIRIFVKSWSLVCLSPLLSDLKKLGKTGLPVGHFLFQDTTGYSSNVRMPSSCGYRDLIPIVLSMFHPFFLCPFSSGCQMPMDKSTTGSLPGRHGSTEPQGACCARNPEASRWCGMCSLHFDPFWSKNNIHSIYIVYHNRLKSILLKSPTLQDPAAVLSASTGAQG